MSHREWMTFYLADELYAVDILTVKEIRSPTSVTRIPLASPDVMGAINLRGDIVPIIDLRQRLGLLACDDTQDTVFIIVQFLQAQQRKTLGMRVDAVADVIQMSERAIATQNQSEHNTCIAAIAESEQGSIALLDVSRLLNVSAGTPVAME